MAEITDNTQDWLPCKHAHNHIQLTTSIVPPNSAALLSPTGVRVKALHGGGGGLSSDSWCAPLSCSIGAG